uniref:Pro-sigmaK processing inhibitor BofA n=1 Tax=Ammonifex degensii TaxID=42838 RepID=A0A7C1IZG5_9THEO
MVNWDWKVLLCGGIGLIGLYLIGSALLIPLRLIGRLVVGLVVGRLLLTVVNLLGTVFHFHIAVNPLTMLVAGVFPVPGLVLLTLLAVFVV